MFRKEGSLEMNQKKSNIEVFDPSILGYGYAHAYYEKYVRFRSPIILYAMADYLLALSLEDEEKKCLTKN